MDPSPNRRMPQYSLGAMLILVSLVAAYWAGWASHRAWNRRNLAETMRPFLEKVQADYPIKVETIDGSDVYMIKGKQEDVDEAQTMLDAAAEAATK